MPQMPSSLDRLPKVVILDTRHLVRFLRGKISALTNVEVTEEEIIAVIIEALQYDSHNLDLEIDVSCELVTREHLGFTRCTEEDGCGLKFCDNGCVSEKEAVETARSLSEFGHSLHKELKQLNAYLNGYLWYSFKQMLGSDVILEKITVPES